jgi:addiction module HigA family antidote
VILSYRHKGLKKFAETGAKAGIQPKHAVRLRRLLTALDVASQAGDMNAPANNLHSLKGDLQEHLGRIGQWQLASDLRIPRRGRNLGGLSGLPLTMIFQPAHPGEVLREYLGSISVKEAAERLGVTRAHLSRILNGRAGITAPMSLRLSAALGTTADFWLKMQIQRDLWLARKQGTPKVRPFPRLARREASATHG